MPGDKTLGIEGTVFSSGLRRPMPPVGSLTSFAEIEEGRAARELHMCRVSMVFGGWKHCEKLAGSNERLGERNRLRRDMQVRHGTAYRQWAAT